ncbi:hypothetical protein VNO77_23208 [Canavalia gladiata]|uniref:Uncharacterized protein n=1 Tax=Canavalia gladiata TaxID=3824 RepID=A0AAN9L996_CANGL
MHEGFVIANRKHTCMTKGWQFYSGSLTSSRSPKVVWILSIISSRAKRSVSDLQLMSLIAEGNTITRNKDPSIASHFHSQQPLGHHVATDAGGVQEKVERIFMSEPMTITEAVSLSTRRDDQRMTQGPSLRSKL